MVGILFGGFQRIQRRARHIHILKELSISCIIKQFWYIVECLAMNWALTIQGMLKRIIHVKISGLW